MNEARRARRARIAAAWEARRRERRGAVDAAGRALDAARHEAGELALRRDAWAGRSDVLAWEALAAIDIRLRGARALEERRAFELGRAEDALREAERRLRALDLLAASDAERERLELRRAEAKLHDDLARRLSAWGKVS